MAEDFSCGLVLLAAGASRRMGRPKQLLPVAGQPLLRHVVEQTLAAPVSRVIVVLGAYAETIAPVLADLPVQIALNEDWASGMGSSVRKGLQQLMVGTPAATAVIIALADQPDCPADHFRRLVETQRTTGHSIIASTAGGVTGPPALFTAEWFPRLLTLRGDAGARMLLQEQQGALGLVPLAGASDLDTPADYELFLRDPARPAG